MNRVNVSSGSYLEPQIGFSRAVKIGNTVAVGGTAPIAAGGGTDCIGDVHGQTKRCLEIALTALTEAGGTAEDVIRTRIILTDINTFKDAARAHAEKMDGCVQAALDQAGVPLSAVDAIAVTAGPGLIGGVLAGVMCAKGLAAGAGLPLVGVNHLAGHALTPRLTDGVVFPYLMLLVSGGHCQFLIVHAPDKFTRLGGTIDDAPGEAFDKTARLLGLRQPGGPSVEQAAQTGDATRFVFPRPLLDRPGCDMSFSGLKTALLRERDRQVATDGGLRRGTQADLCAGMGLLEEALSALEGEVLPGETIFKLYDTYGFPYDLTEDALRARDIGVDRDGFDAAMERQKAAARAAWTRRPPRRSHRTTCDPSGPPRPRQTPARRCGTRGCAAPARHRPRPARDRKTRNGGSASHARVAP